MSRRLLHRVRRLELAPGGVRGPCRACGGFGRWALVDERHGEKGPKGCRSCGKVSKVMVLEADEDAGVGVGVGDGPDAR